MVRSLGPTGNNGLPNHSTRPRGAVVRAGMVENRSYEMSVGMLSPSSAPHTSAADEGRYNAGTVLPQGAFDVQSIRATQTADPRAKQTHPSGPARGSVRVNKRLGDGGAPGSMTAGRFHSEKVVESFLGQPPLAGPPPLADGSGAQRGGGGNLRCPPEPAPAKAGGLKNAIAAVSAGASWQRCRTHFMANLLTRVPKRAQPGVATQDLLAWYAPSTSNCLPPRSTANWIEWWNNFGSRFPRWPNCWRTLRRTFWPSRPSQWPTGRSCGPITRRNG